MRISIDDTVPAVRAMWQAARERTSPFHLAACSACGGPSFMQPCPNCGAYPDLSEPSSVTESRRAAAMASGAGSRDAFARRVEREGGIGAWYFASFRRTVAYQGSGRFEQPNPIFRADIDGLVERARQVEWPSAEEIWDRVSGDRQPMHADWAAISGEWRDMAVLAHGEESFQALQRVQEGRSWHPWPENCREGWDILREHGISTPASLGIPEAGPATKGAQAPRHAL